MTVGADRSRQFPDADHRTRASDPLDVALQFGVPQRQLQAESHRLGVNAMGAADHRCFAMFERPIANRVGQPIEIFQDQVAGFAHLQGLGGVDHVG